MNQKTIKLDQFQPRGYQQKLVDAFEGGKIKRFVAIWPRRAGKDICAFNLVVRAALRRVGTYFYVFPTFSMGRRILWDAIDIDGRKVIDHYLPEEIVSAKNQQQMKIVLINGSQIQVIGSDDVDKSLVGTNAVGIVYSEYALQDPHAWQLAIPILKASAGWALFISTVRGRNHFYDLYEAVKDRDDWFCEKLTIEDTQHITVEEIEKEIESGQISRDLAMQEFWNDFNLGVEGNFYGKFINDLRIKEQITNIPWNPSLLVNTAWDLGFSDPTCVIFFQVHGPNVHIIDYIQETQLSLVEVIQLVHKKPYSYGKHLGPFDVAVTEYGSGINRWRIANEAGLIFTRYMDDVPSIEAGIEKVKCVLPRCWIDEKKCGSLIKSLENYSERKNSKSGNFSGKPAKNLFTHGADAMRYLAVGLSKVSNSNSSPEELKQRYNKAMYGESVNTGFFSEWKGY